MWVNNYNLVIKKLSTFLFGLNTKYILISSNGSYIQSPFRYIGIDPHNILIKTFLYYGIFGAIIVYFLLKNLFKINKIIILTFLLYWSFEPSLGLLQFFCIFYLLFLYKNSTKIFTNV